MSGYHMKRCPKNQNGIKIEAASRHWHFSVQAKPRHPWRILPETLPRCRPSMAECGRQNHPLFSVLWKPLMTMLLSLPSNHHRLWNQSNLKQEHVLPSRVCFRFWGSNHGWLRLNITNMFRPSGSWQSRPRHSQIIHVSGIYNIISYYIHIYRASCIYSNNHRSNYRCAFMLENRRRMITK